MTEENATMQGQPGPIIEVGTVAVVQTDRTAARIVALEEALQREIIAHHGSCTHNPCPARAVLHAEVEA